MHVANLNIKYLPLCLIAFGIKQYKRKEFDSTQYGRDSNVFWCARKCKKGVSLSALDWGMPRWQAIAKKPNCHMSSTALRCHAVENIVGMNGNPNWQPDLDWRCAEESWEAFWINFVYIHNEFFSYICFIWWKTQCTGSTTRQTLGRLLTHLSVSET